MTNKLEVGKFYESTDPNDEYIYYFLAKTDEQYSDAVFLWLRDKCMGMYNLQFNPNGVFSQNGVHEFNFKPTTKTFDIHKYFEVAKCE